MTNAKKRSRAVVKKLSEPSTWAGLAALGMLVGMTFEQVQGVANAGAALSGLAAVVLGEGG